MKLQNKTALITGGTSGMGLATAQLFADEGARVYVTGSTPSSVEAARSALGSRATVLQSDAGDITAIDALVAGIVRETDGIDVLFLNAGILGGGPLETLDEADFDRVYRTNVKGPYFTLRAAIPHLRPGGAVLINASINASLGMPGTSVYAGTKAALRSLGRVAAAELAGRGIRVNVLSPGLVDTGITEKYFGDAAAQAKAALTARIPLGRWGKNEEAARAALFLASSDSSFITGEELVVDGGFTRV